MTHTVTRLSDNRVLFAGSYNSAHAFMMTLFRELNRPYNFNDLYRLQ